MFSMSKGIIKIFGDIGGQVNLVDVISQVKAAGEVLEYVVLINSPGGFVDLGYDIHNFLRNLGKPVSTIIDSECSSIATVIALAGDKGKRYIISGAQFMVHNPWTMEMGDASKLADTAEQLQEVENQLIKFYSKNTGIPEEGIRPLMKAETFMTAEDAVKMGFADKVLTPDEAKEYGPSEKLAVKAFAKYNPKINNMKNNNEKPTKVEELFGDLKTVFNKHFGMKPKAIDYKTADGVEVHVQTEAAEPAKGDMVTKGGQPCPNEELVMEGGMVIKTDADSKVAEVIPATSPEEQEAQKKAKAEAGKDSKIKELEGKLADKDKEIESLKTLQAKQDEAVKEIETKFEVLAKAIKSSYLPEDVKTKFRTKAGEGESDIVKKMQEKIAAARGVKQANN